MIDAAPVAGALTFGSETSTCRRAGWHSSTFSLALWALGLVLTGCGHGASADAATDSGTHVDAGDDTSAGDAGPTAPANLTVATWNLKNFFDSADDPQTYDDLPTSGQVARKVTEVGAILGTLDADVLVLQEVENVGILDRLADGPLAGMGYDQRVLMEAFDPRGINVGFLSRLPVLNTVTHSDESFPNATDTRNWRFARDAPELFVDVGGFTVIVMGVHFLSQLAGDAEQADHRLAEAMQVRRILDQRIAFGNNLAVLAGDMNDVPTSPPLAAVLDGGGLLDITRAVPESSRYTTAFSGVRRQFDYIIATPDMANFTVSSSVRVLHGSNIDTASDHMPVVATFHLVP